ncbi:uncharacterized protein LOC129289004 [Prosopis cineraria]|uniref:uncharacterized protein LOC129289004 n=1 Tax=Prosopis cineraria TaxID=364024 RepID=UPI0024101A13|nr:uncharacterized protein LOC129289004 [Prosopis cineraria]
MKAFDPPTSSLFIRGQRKVINSKAVHALLSFPNDREMVDMNGDKNKLNSLNKDFKRDIKEIYRDVVNFTHEIKQRLLKLQGKRRGEEVVQNHDGKEEEEEDLGHEDKEEEGESVRDEKEDEGGFGEDEKEDKKGQVEGDKNKEEGGFKDDEKEEE